MTTQNKGVPAIPPALPNVSEAQIRQENAEAALASSGYIPEQTGASDAVTPPPLPTAVPLSQGDKIRESQQAQADDREALMSDIAARRRAHLQDEHMQDAYGLDNDDEVNDNQPQEQETQVAQAEQQAQEVPPPVQDDQPRFFTDAAGKRMVELLVNGQRQIVDESRVIAAAQKIEAGDERLRQAHFERQQLDAERAQLERDRAALQIPQPSTTDAENLKQQLREGFDRVYNNGDEAALDGLVDLLVQGRQSTTPSADQVADAAIARINQNAWNGALQNDVAAYESDPAFADITGNAMLAQRAVAMATDYMTRHPEVRSNGTTPRQVMNHCATLVRQEAQQYAQALGIQPAPQPQALQQGQSRSDAVEQRKAQAGTTVVSGGAPRTESAQRTVAQDGGRSPSSMDSKVAAFAGLQNMRTQSVARR